MLELETVSSGDQTPQPVHLHSLPCLMQLICAEQLSPNLGSSNNLIQLSLNPQAKNNPLIINQHCGVSSPDMSEALTGPRGHQWREDQGGSPPSPAGANQNKSWSERPSMCSSHLRPPKENISAIPIYLCLERQLSTLKMYVCVRNEAAQQGNRMRDELRLGFACWDGWTESNCFPGSSSSYKIP